MLRDLLLAVGIPAALLLVFTLLLQRGTPLPSWVQRFSERPAWIWNAGIGLLIALSLLRWLQQR